MDNTLIYGLATLFCGIVGLLIKVSFKSKCSDIGLCCGLIKIKRNIEAENQIEMKEIELGFHKEENK